MQTFNDHLNRSRGSIQASEAIRHEVAVRCYHAEQSGGFTSTWHEVAQMLHPATCNCVPCRRVGGWEG